MTGFEWAKAMAKQPERILCAANWFDDGERHPHQPSNLDSGYVICGLRHANCFHMPPKPTAEWVELGAGRIRDQGFLTNRNRFVGREEALRIAENAGQVVVKTSPEHLLFSEDLW